MEKRVNPCQQREGGGAFSFSRVSIEGNIIETRVGALLVRLAMHLWARRAGHTVAALSVNRSRDA